MFTVGEPPPEDFRDPEGNEIANPAVVEWLSEKGFTQDDIDALGEDAAATAKLYECYLCNCDFRVQDAGASGHTPRKPCKISLCAFWTSLTFCEMI